MEFAAKKKDFKVREAIHSRIDEAIAQHILVNHKAAAVPELFYKIYKQQQSSEYAGEVSNFIDSNPTIALYGLNLGLGTNSVGQETSRLKEYIEQAKGFNSAYLSGDITYAREVIQGALVSAHTKGANEKRLRELLQELWLNRWFVGAEEAARFHLIVLSRGKKEELDILASDSELLNSLEFELKKQVELAKANADNLGDWFLSIFGLLPSVLTLLALSEESRVDARDDIREYCNSLQADIFTTLHVTCSNFFAGCGNSILSEYFYTARNESDSYSEFQETLDYYVEERCVIPQFWKREALKLYKFEEPNFPRKMMVFDPVRLQCLLYAAGSAKERTELLF